MRDGLTVRNTRFAKRAADAHNTISLRGGLVNWETQYKRVCGHWKSRRVSGSPTQGSKAEISCLYREPQYKRKRVMKCLSPRRLRCEGRPQTAVVCSSAAHLICCPNPRTSRKKSLRQHRRRKGLRDRIIVAARCLGNPKADADDADVYIWKQVTRDSACMREDCLHRDEHNARWILLYAKCQIRGILCSDLNSLPK